MTDQPTWTKQRAQRAAAGAVAAVAARIGSRGARAAAGTLVGELQRAVGVDRVLTREVDRRTYSYDAFLDEALPEAIVFPATVDDVARIVAIARRHGAPLVPRGCGTNLSGGTVPIAGGIVVELSRMDRLLAVDLERRLVRVEPGVYNTDVSAAVDARGFFYAPDPASGKACSIGGNVGEGSGGPHCFKYGVTANHVLGLTVVLPSGEIVRLGGDVADLPGYDLVGTFIGSEGTLGICVEATLSVLPKPEVVRTMLAVYDSIERAGETVSAIIAAGIVPATLEMMDNLVIQAVEDSLAAGYPRDAAAVLLIEVDGLKEGVERQSAEVKALCEAMGATSVRVARDDAEREALWKGRRGAFGAISRLAPNYLVADGTVPRARLPETLRRVLEIAAEHDLRVGNVFHAGDGNLHPLILFDSRDREQTQSVLRAGMEMLAVCAEMGGTITGEHGIGTEKLEAMGLVFSEEELRLQWLVKRCFDPEGTFNPGKLLPALPAAAAASPAGVALRAAGYAPPPTGVAPPPTGAVPSPAAGSGAARPVTCVDDVRDALLAAAEAGRVVVPRGGGTRADWGAPVPANGLTLQLRGLDAVLECDAGNLVMHAQAGVSVSAARDAARAAGLLLPLDAGQPDVATLGGALACNEQGPRRARFGSVRDVVLGVGVVLPGGEYVRLGGQTMKNVAGLNLTRLFVGALGTLGVVVDAWLRLLPLPQCESYVAAPVTGPADASALVRAVVDAGLAPDLAELLPASCVEGACPPPRTRPATQPRVLLLGFAGDEGSVARQTGDALRLAAAGERPPATVIEPAGGPQALVDSVASFRHGARGAGYGVLARAQVPAAEAAGYLASAEAAAARLGVELVASAGLASGLIQLAAAGDGAALSALLLLARGEAERLDGALVVCHGWEALDDGFDGWGRRDAQVVLMRLLKDAIDPRGLLDRGRYVGGL